MCFNEINTARDMTKVESELLIKEKKFDTKLVNYEHNTIKRTIKNEREVE